VNTADDHLNRLLCADIEDPWYHTFIRNVKEFVNPPKLPPLEVTSKPVPVKDIWGLYGRKKQSFMMSTGFQIGASRWFSFSAPTRPCSGRHQDRAVRIGSRAARSENEAAEADFAGRRRRRRSFSAPASYGKLPKFALKQFTPPVAVYNNMNPKLAMEPTLIGDPNTQVANVDYPLYGDPSLEVHDALERTRFRRRHR
jgi:periplasmic protein TonB